jgi:hypothetical protein
LALLTRAEIGVLAWGVIVAGAFLSRRLHWFRPMVVWPAVMMLLVYGFFWTVVGERISHTSLADIYLHPVDVRNTFTAMVSGSDAPLKNLMLMFQSFLCYLAVALWFVA